MKIKSGDECGLSSLISIKRGDGRCETGDGRDVRWRGVPLSISITRTEKIVKMTLLFCFCLAVIWLGYAAEGCIKHRDFLPIYISHFRFDFEWFL